MGATEARIRAKKLLGEVAGGPDPQAERTAQARRSGHRLRLLRLVSIEASQRRETSNPRRWLRLAESFR
jgi:hypothetical protein